MSQTPNTNNKLCEICKNEIPDQVRAQANRKYCPQCFSEITKNGINEAMKKRANVSSQQATSIIKEQDIRNLAAGLAQPEDFADIAHADYASVVERLYIRSKFSDPAKRQEIMNYFSAWAIGMQPAAIDMDYIRCCECNKAFGKDDRIEIQLSKSEILLLSNKSENIHVCSPCHSKVKDLLSASETVAKDNTGIDYNNLSLSKAVLMGGLNPYKTPQWVLANPNCWKYIHKEQEQKHIGRLVHGDMTFMGNDIAHGM